MKLIIRRVDMGGLRRVRHSNELNQTLSSLPLSAKKVLFSVLSQINSKQALDESKTIYVTASDYAKITKGSITNAYRHLKEGADYLSTVGLRLEKEELEVISQELGLSGKTPNYMKLNLMEYCVYNKDEGRIGVKFTETAKNYISSIVGHERKYTSQALISVAMLSTIHATTLYQLIRKKVGLSQLRYSKGFTISLEELKYEMGLLNRTTGEELYPMFKIFKRDVLNKAKEEINVKTEIFDLDFTVEKIGRKIDKINFTYRIDENEFKINYLLKED